MQIIISAYCLFDFDSNVEWKSPETETESGKPEDTRNVSEIEIDQRPGSGGLRESRGFRNAAR